MNKLEEYSINKSKAARLFTLLMLCLCLLPLTVNCAALTPLRTVLSANVLYADSIIMEVLDYLMALLEIVAFAVTFSIVIFSIFLGSARITANAVIIFAVSLLLHLPISILMNIPIYGTVGTVDEIIASCFSKLAYVLFCLIHLLIVYFVATYMRNRFLIPTRRRKKLGMKDVSDVQLLPVKQIYDSKNPLQAAAVSMCIVVVALKLLLHLVGDIYMGFPSELGGIISLTVSYLVDVAYGFVAYIIALLIFSLAYDKTAQKNSDEAAAPSDESELLN